LQSSGFETVTARTVDQALDYVKDDVFIEAVWLDHFLMGHKTGIDFLSAMKNHDKYKNIPVFVVANTGGPETQHSYLQLGVTKYYVKSNHRLDEIVHEVSKAIKKERDKIQ
jgi:DNA-binding NtrC family response regulator